MVLSKTKLSSTRWNNYDTRHSSFQVRKRNKWIRHDGPCWPSTYLDFAHVQGVCKSIDTHIGAKKERQGWTDGEILLSLILMNLAGGECVEDLSKLESDEGFCKTLTHAYLKLSGMKRKKRRNLVKRWRKEKKRSIPSPSAVFRYLHSFHNSEQESLRIPHKAYIPEANKNLKGFTKVNSDFCYYCHTVSEHTLPGG